MAVQQGIKRIPNVLFSDDEAVQLWLNTNTLDPSCDSCYRLLSALPIRITIHGYKICDRCYRSNEYKDVGSAISISNLLSQKNAFKCSNFYDGCNRKNLHPDEIASHEKDCITTRPLKCRFCSYEGSILQVLNHFVDLHPHSICLDGVILFDLHSELPKKLILMVVNGDVFFVEWKSIGKSVRVQIKCVTVPNTRHCRLHFSKQGEAQFPLTMFNEYGLLRLQSETNFETSKRQLADIFGEDGILMCKISIEEIHLEARTLGIVQREEASDSEKLLKAVNEPQVELEKDTLTDICNNAIKLIKPLALRMLRCTMCKKIAPGDYMSVCPEIHSRCSNCLNNSFCTLCSRIRPFTSLPFIKEFTAQCDWPNCEKYVDFYHYFSHKSECKERIYRCPLTNCGQTRISSAALARHWHCKVPSLNQNDFIYFDKNKIKSEYLNWLYNHNIYSLKINFEATYVEVLLEEIDVVPNNDVKDLSCALLIGKTHFQVPVRRTSNRYEGTLDFSKHLSDNKASNSPFLLRITMNPLPPPWPVATDPLASIERRKLSL